MLRDWLELYKQMHSGAAKMELACPECRGDSIDFQYVGDPVKRVGYLDMWCTKCGKGVHFSRVSIPHGRDMIPFNAPDHVVIARIPNFEHVEDSGAED